MTDDEKPLTATEAFINLKEHESRGRYLESLIRSIVEECATDMANEIMRKLKERL